MSLSEIVQAGPQVDLLAGGDADPSCRLLSIAQLQAAWQARAATAGRCLAGPTRSSDRDGPRPDDRAAGEAGHRPGPWPANGGDVPADCAAAGPPARVGVIGVPAGWVAVVAAHAGAGASTVALAICDAAAGAGWPARLVETAPPGRSGLAAVTRSELGVDSSGCWRRGVRGQLTVDRRASAEPPACWPADPSWAGGLAVADLGLPVAGDLRRLVAGGHRTVVVFRVTVPGVRLAEPTLAGLVGLPVVAAAIGPGRWPGGVSASAGPRLRALRTAGRLVGVPVDRRLERAGLSQRPLPTALRAAGRALLDHLDHLDKAHLNV